MIKTKTTGNKVLKTGNPLPININNDNGVTRVGENTFKSTSFMNEILSANYCTHNRTEQSYIKHIVSS